MTQEKIVDAITELDPDILDRYFAMKNESVAKKKSKKCTWMKWASAVAACFGLVIAVTFIAQYIPTEYNLNYSYVGDNGKETYIASENVWIYYAENGHIKRERVRLPCTAENVFNTWKHLNSIGDDVKLLECKTTSNGKEITSDLDGEEIAHYKQGDRFVLNITVTKDLRSYAGHEVLVDSLKKTMSEYSDIDLSEIKVCFS